MKNLNSKELKRYRVPPPPGTTAKVNTILKGTKVYSFEFPLFEVPDGNPVLKTIVLTNEMRGSCSARITASVYTKGSMMRPITPSEVYLIKDALQNPGECLVWQYNPIREKLRASNFRAITGKDFDMNNFVLHMYQFDGRLPPLHYAYARKTQKNKGYVYCRGQIDGWKFVHVQTKDLFPWVILQKIADREFGNSLVQVFFNQETKEHPNEYVIWCKPGSIESV